MGVVVTVDCVVSYRNSTSNHNSEVIRLSTAKVVSYRNSTSNHNLIPLYSYWVQVVSYRNSTSNHNAKSGNFALAALYLIEILHQTTTRKEMDNLEKKLYLIEILHQTTTLRRGFGSAQSLYLIEILHQTTTCIRCGLILLSCILSKFYIKPQPPHYPVFTS